MYVKHWDAFVRDVKTIYRDNPDNARYCTRWSHRRGLLVLKMSDNRRCAKFKTRSAIILNRFEALTNALLGHIQERASLPKVTPVTSADAVDNLQTGLPPSLPLAVSVAASAGGGTTSKKKKKGKKK